MKALKKACFQLSTRAKQGILFSLFVLFFLCLGYFSSRSSRFCFSEIIISTSSANEEIENQIKRELLPELGKNLFSISLVDIEKKILQLSPVESVRLHRAWPSALVVEAIIKTPIALQFNGNQLWTVGKNLLRIESVKNPPPLPLLINFEKLLSVRTGSRQQEMLQEFFSFLSEISKREAGPGLEFEKISEIRWSEESGLILWSYELGIEIEMGFEHFSKGWALADQSIIWANERNIALSQIDTSYSTRVVARPKVRLQNSQIGLNLEELVHRKDSGPAAAR